MHFEVNELLGYYGTGSVPQGVNIMRLLHRGNYRCYYRLFYHCYMLFLSLLFLLYLSLLLSL